MSSGLNGAACGDTYGKPITIARQYANFKVTDGHCRVVSFSGVDICESSD